MSQNQIPTTGVDALLADVSRRADEAAPGWRGTVDFVLQISEAYAYIHLQDVYNPLRFLRQMEGAPPVQLGTAGFKSDLLEKGDENPARHYMAFVFVGFWLPTLLATGVLWLWEFLGYLRYRFRWSSADMRSGRLGITHGRLVRRHGPTILPSLIARDLAADSIV